MRRILLIALALFLAGCMNRAEHKGGAAEVRFEKHMDTATKAADKVTTVSIAPSPVAPPAPPAPPEQEPMPVKVRIAGGEYVIPRSYVATITVEEDVEQTSDKSHWEGSGEGVGPTLHDNKGSTEGFEAGAPEFSIDEDGVNSETNKSKTKVKLGTTGTWLLIIGGFCIVAGAVLYWLLKDITLSAALGIAGVTLIAFAFFNWLALLGFVAVLALLIYAAYKKGLLKQFASIFVSKVEELKVENPPAAEALTEKIGEGAAEAGVETPLRNTVESLKP